MEALVDHLIEDEAERESLLAKPTCFIILGRPGVGKSVLAKNIAETWRCILIDDTDLLNTHIKNKTKEGIELLNILFEGETIPNDVVLQLILARINSPDIEHYGYVLSCLPFISEVSLKVSDQIELIKNLKLTPDFIINIKCADEDLVLRLSGLRQHLVSGQLYTRDQWKQEEVFTSKENSNEQEVVDDDEEEPEEEGLSKDAIDQMVWTPENLPINAFSRINTYKNNLLRPLEDYMAEHNPLYILELDGNNTLEELQLSLTTRLQTMAVKPVSVPVLLSQYVEEELPETIDTEYLLRFMASISTAAPGFRWRRSRWGRICPVALKEGNIIPGKPEFSVGFQDKLYILSSKEACQKFFMNPRSYLLPPMPRPPCKVSIVGPPQAGKSTMCHLLAQHYSAKMLNLEELSRPLRAKAEQERLDKIKEETTKAAVEKIEMKMRQDGGNTLVTEDHPEVKALVLHAIEEAKQMSPSPFDMYVHVLEKHIKETEAMNSNSEARTGWVLDNFPKTLSEIDVLEQAGFLPDTIICLRDSDRHQVLKRVYEKNKETVNKAFKTRLQDELSQRNEKVLNEKEQESATWSNPEMVVESADALQDDFILGYPDIPEMKEYKEQMEIFDGEWEQMQSNLTVNHFNLEIGSKSPESLLQEIVENMEKPFQHVAWELSTVDLAEEEEDMEALAAVEREEEDNSDDDTERDEDETDSTLKRLLGDTRHFCPVALKTNNVLQPSTDKISAKYRERTYYFSTLEARESFLQNPAQYITQKEPLQPPALRIFLLGARGSGKSTHGEWLAQKLGLFHIQFREQLQMQIMAKTNMPVTSADEAVHLESNSEDLEALIQEELVENENEIEKKFFNIEEEFMDEEELAIKAYLSLGEPLSSQILDMIVLPCFKEEPYMSTGFILEGFPNDPKQVEYILERQLFPDVVVVLEVDVADVQKRLLPAYIERWRNLHSKHEEQLKLLRHLRQNNRDEKISKRRAELLEDQGPDESRFSFRHQMKKGDEESEDAYNIDDIEAILEAEFPEEKNNDKMENKETEDAATERIKGEMHDRFERDATNLMTVTELLVENNIPKLVLNPSSKLRIMQYHLLQKIQPMMANRESLFQTTQPISYRLAQKLLLSSYKTCSAFGCWDPVQCYKEKDTIQPIQWPLSTTYPLLLSQHIYFFGSKENRSTFMLNPLKYLQQAKPTATFPIKIAVVGPPKSGKTTVAQMFAEKYGLARLSIGTAMRMVLSSKEETDLAVQMRRYLTQGLVLPDELAIQCLELALLSPVCSIQGYVLDGFPMTLNQAELMESRSIIPMIVFELNLNSIDILKRGCIDKMNPKRPHLVHDSSQILLTWESSYKKEIRDVRQHFQEQHRNWFTVNALKNKWWIWDCILKQVNISMKCMQSYLERTQTGKAACINRLCITPKEFDCRLGEFGHYCPVCLALLHHLVDCSETADLTHAAEYKKHFHRLCGEKHLERFLSTPDEFVAPRCPNHLPQSHLLPRKLTELQVGNKFPKQAEMKGFCPVTYMDGNQRYEALVRGKIEHAVEYKEKLYIFETQQKRERFLRTPETYWAQKLPSKVTPPCEPVSLTSLPTLGYIEQGMDVAVIKAMTAVGSLKPKYPFVSIQRSALLYVALHLKAFNPKATDYTRQQYKKKLASFEEDSELVSYLSSAMRGGFKPPGERPVDFDFKLNRFLALEAQGASGAL